jgi:hypothetical protein
LQAKKIVMNGNIDEFDLTALRNRKMIRSYETDGDAATEV